MIPAGLEAAIQCGKARAHTFTLGAGGSARIPVPKNKFIVIYHWDYWHFVDIPEQNNAPAKAILSVTTTDPAFTDNATFDFGFVGNFVAFVDFANPAGTLANVQALLTIIAPGWTVNLIVSGGGLTFNFFFSTTSPGAIYNGVIVNYISSAIIPPVVIPGVFAGGIDDPITVSEFLQHATHQLTFRSRKSTNHFVIQEPVKIFPQHAEVSDPLYFANLGGFYPKDCYLVHTETVQINVVGVPQVENWAVQFLPPSNKSQEFPAFPGGVGYGQAGFLSFNTVREVLFDGLTQQYLPLTADFENIAAIPGEYREQFQVAVNAANALHNPKNKGGIVGNFPTYPLVNIDYVIVDQNYNDFVKASNG